MFRKQKIKVAQENKSVVFIPEKINKKRACLSNFKDFLGKQKISSNTLDAKYHFTINFILCCVINLERNNPSKYI